MAGTTTTSRDNAGHVQGALRDLLLQFQKAITDMETLRQNDVSVALTSGTVAIQAASNPAAKTTTIVRAIVMAANGTMTYVALAAGNLAALVGTVLQNNVGIWFFAVDSTGAVTQYLAQGATRGAIALPAVPATQAVFAAIEVNPTTAAFIGGTTALDAANTNAVFMNFTASPILGPTQVAAGLLASKIGDLSATAITT